MRKLLEGDLVKGAGQRVGTLWTHYYLSLLFCLGEANTPQYSVVPILLDCQRIKVWH